MSVTKPLKRGIMKIPYGALNPLVKRAMGSLPEKDQDNNNLVMLATWKELGMREQIGGVAFYFVKYFLENSPPVESIARERRRITNERIEGILEGRYQKKFASIKPTIKTAVKVFRKFSKVVKNLNKLEEDHY